MFCNAQVIGTSAMLSSVDLATYMEIHVEFLYEGKHLKQTTNNMIGTGTDKTTVYNDWIVVIIVVLKKSTNLIGIFLL